MMALIPILILSLSYTLVGITMAVAKVTETPSTFRGIWVPGMHSVGREEVTSIIESWKSRYITDVFWRVDLYNMVSSPMDFSEVIRVTQITKLKVHIWGNLFRLNSSPDSANMTVHSHDVCRTSSDVCYKEGGDTWLNPLSKIAQSYVKKSLVDVLSRYRVSGIHIDDTFYPASIKGEPSVRDDNLYSQYLNNRGTLSKNDWRLRGIRDFVSGLNRMVKTHRPEVQFSVNTFGLYDVDDDVNKVIYEEKFYVTKTSSLWPRTHHVIGDFLAPMMSWVPDEDGTPHDTCTNPILMDKSLTSARIRNTITGDQRYRVLDPSWSIFTLNSMLGVNTRHKRSDADLKDEVKFQLFTSMNQSEAIAFDEPYTYQNWTGDNESRLFIIIHGYFSGSHKEWIKNLRIALLNVTSNSWVVVVDWGTLADSPVYKNSRNKINVVADKLIAMLNVVMDTYGVKAEQMHCIGHSLGAHTCGLAGKKYYFGRISGLDPAGPMFDVNDMSARLAYTDARFVDIIHTDVGLGELNFGMEEAIGDVDFYPNGGSWRQPGCWVPICSHRRAPKYYAESVTDDCYLATHKCTSEHSLPSTCEKKGNESTYYTKMGYYTNSYNKTGIYYLQTGSSSPYCSGKAYVESPFVFIGGIVVGIILLLICICLLASKCTGHRIRRGKIADWLQTKK